MKSESDHKAEMLEWLVVPSQKVIIGCLKAYKAHTQWKQPKSCAVCSWDSQGADISVVTIPFGEPDSHFNFNILLIEDVMIIKYCIVATMLNKFTFGHDAIDSLMLFKPAVVITQSGDANIAICSECKLSLL